ncbi:SLAP domain-containing protein [Clostridium estertheticum]|uniref:SLAP domain-containing protein n=1 Tax=Clostridium estertheticum TaxID=238834 RepID=UPI001C6F1CC8|nr:SLAP domain-containing protein [Clostridium estertheticum]MBW9173594.1 SLAP domain-containing protein [Clostridium estertheticum]WLC75227.1 SLAP domain-containing protein [Clostridium estertheticum]
MKNDVKKAKLKLYINDEHEAAHAVSKKEFYSDELESLPDMNEGDININTTYVFDLGDKVEVGVYFRNGLSKAINFDKVPLKILNSNDEVMAKQIFELREVGDIPAFSAVPWRLFFSKENVLTNKIVMQEGWHIVFDTNIKAYNSIKTEFENVPPDPEFDKLRKYLEKLPLMSQGNISISLYEVEKNSDGELGVALIIRNASDKKVKVEKIPITIKNNENDKIVAIGTFNIDNMEICSLKARYLKLSFKAEQVLEPDFNVKNLSVYFNE